MRFVPKYKNENTDEYYCELTTDLDKLAGLDKEEWYSEFDSCRKHYVVIDALKEKNIIAIRIPGGTLGGIYYDNNNVITNIKIDTGYIVKTYPSNVEDIINEKYIGKKLDI